MLFVAARVMRDAAVYLIRKSFRRLPPYVPPLISPAALFRYAAFFFSHATPRRAQADAAICCRRCR